MAVIREMGRQGVEGVDEPRPGGCRGREGVNERYSEHRFFSPKR